MDLVNCRECGFEGLVPQLQRTCPSCRKWNTLRWTYSSCCSQKIEGQEEERHCSKCGKIIK